MEYKELNKELIRLTLMNINGELTPTGIDMLEELRQALTELEKQDKKIITLDVFGMKINIKPKASVVTVTKEGDSLVILKDVGQRGDSLRIPINTVEKYGKTADEFITKFQHLNFEATDIPILDKNWNRLE